MIEEFKWHEPIKPPEYKIENVRVGDYLQCLELDRSFLFDGIEFTVTSRTFIGGRVQLSKEKGIALLKGKTLAVSYFINFTDNKVTLPKDNKTLIDFMNSHSLKE